MRRVGDGRWAVVFRGETIVAYSRQPELEACRVLQARGMRGHLLFYHRCGTPACGLYIEVGASKSPPGMAARAGRGK